MRALPRDTLGLAAVVAFQLAAAVSMSACKRAPAPVCSQDLEVVSDPRPVKDLKALPVTAQLVQLSHDVRQSDGCMDESSTSSATYALGRYRVTWQMRSNRGRPGPAYVTISLPGACGGIGHGYESFDEAPGAELHHDAARDIDVLILPTYPDSTALVFRRVPAR
jgi:hypothetical protein